MFPPVEYPVPEVPTWLAAPEEYAVLAVVYGFAVYNASLKVSPPLAKL